MPGVGERKRERERERERERPGVGGGGRGLLCNLGADTVEALFVGWLVA